MKNSPTLTDSEKAAVQTFMEIYDRISKDFLAWQRTKLIANVAAQLRKFGATTLSEAIQEAIEIVKSAEQDQNPPPKTHD